MTGASVPTAPIESGNPSRPLFSSELVETGRFWCSPRHPRFRTAGEITRHTFVFPETAVWIAHEGATPFLGHPARVAMYNAGQRYVRRECDPIGDRCTWFSIADDVARDVIAARDPGAARSGRPLRFPYAPVLPATCYRQRLVGRRLLAGGAPDPLFVEESIVNLFAEVIATLYDHVADAARDAPVTRRQHEIVEEVSLQLYRSCTANQSLAAIARSVDLSVFHLCRLFRRATGVTMHAFRRQIRLARALDALGTPDVDLLPLAVDLGYCSHSHFTSVFRRQLGLVPSIVREQLTPAATVAYPRRAATVKQARAQATSAHR